MTWEYFSAEDRIEMAAELDSQITAMKADRADHDPIRLSVLNLMTVCRDRGEVELGMALIFLGKAINQSSVDQVLSTLMTLVVRNEAMTDDPRRN